MTDKLDTWTLTVEITVFAGDMTKESVIANAESLLTNMMDGSDFCNYTVIDATRDGEEAGV